MPPTLRLSVAAAAVGAALAAGPAAAQFSNMYFFGDSLTDAGQFKPVLPPGTGLFTTNPGPIWVTVLGSQYGLTITPSTTGGTDYAYGGARVALTPGQPNIPPTGSAVPIATQVQSAVAKGVDPNATYFLWGGANDIAVQLTAYLSGQITQDQLKANVATVAGQFGQQVGVLKAAGAKYVVVINQPDIGKTPYAVSLGPAAAEALTSLSSLYNTTTMATLDAVGGNQVRVNILAALNEMLADPTHWGLTNVTGSACTASSPPPICTQSTLVSPNAAQTYFYADGYHPTTAGNALIAQVVNSMLTGPMQMGSLPEAPLQVEQAQFRALDGRMWSSLGAPYTGNKLQAWAAYDYGSNDISDTPFAAGNGSGSMNSVALGLDMRVSDSVIAGVAFGYSQDKVDFNNNGGGFTLDETSITGYAGWGHGPWYLGGSVMLGNLDYNDVRRNITLGAATRTENGNTNGNHWAVRLLGGYWFNSSNLVHGPFAKITYQEATVNAFSENGSSSTALSYASQKRDPWQTSLGWQAQGTWGSVHPFGRASWEYRSSSDTQYVTASSATLGGSYSVPAYNPGENWALFVLGASTDFGKVTGYITGTATAGKSDGDGYSVTVGVRVPL